MRLARITATVFGVGYLRPAPGTWGSLVALPSAWAIHAVGGFLLLWLATVIGFLEGWWATHKMTEHQEDHDPSEIVVDELVGQWIAVLPISYFAWVKGISPLSMWPGIVAAFVLFRLFDIWKPGPVGRADRRNDSLGVMLDDVVAGAFAAIGVLVLGGLAHGVMGL